MWGRLASSEGSIPAHWAGLLACGLFLANGALLWGAFSGMEGSLFILRRKALKRLLHAPCVRLQFTSGQIVRGGESSASAVAAKPHGRTC